MKKAIISFILLGSFISSFSQTTPVLVKRDVCDKLIIMPFKCVSCITTDRDIADEIREQVEPIFKSEHSRYCTILTRDDISEINQINEIEKSITSGKNLTDEQTIKLRTKGDRILLGSIRFQGDRSLLVSLKIMSLITTEIEASKVVEIPSSDTDVFSKRTSHLQNLIKELLFKPLPPPPPIVKDEIVVKDVTLTTKKNSSVTYNDPRAGAFIVEWSDLSLKYDGSNLEYNVVFNYSFRGCPNCTTQAIIWFDADHYECIYEGSPNNPSKKCHGSVAVPKNLINKGSIGIDMVFGLANNCADVRGCCQAGRETVGFLPSN